MRNYIIFLLFLVLTNGVAAQTARPQNLPTYDFRGTRFGFTVGTNIMGFEVRQSADFFDLDEVFSIEAINYPGIQLGPLVNFRISNKVDIRSMIVLSFSQRDLVYKLAKNPGNPDTEFYLHTMRMESSLVEFPNYLKYKSVRINNYQGYLMAGVNPKIDLAAQKKYKDDELPKIRLSRYDLVWEAGAGFDFYMQYFKFSVELKYGRGVINLAVDDGTEYAGALDRLNTNLLMLSFHFGG